MARAWPFEDRPEGRPWRPRTPEEFIDERTEIDGVVIRIGLNGAQLILVDRDGAWERWVYPGVEAAVEAAKRLGLDPHVGEYPEELRVRMNTHPTPTEVYEYMAYPEQGEVGPVIPYPENRPRSASQPNQRPSEDPPS